MKDYVKYLLVFVLFITMGIFGGCGGGGGGGNGSNYFSFKEIAGRWEITGASGLFNSYEGEYSVAINNNARNEKLITYIDENNQDLFGNFQMQYYYEIDIKSADVVVSTMAINKNIPARVMIQRISDNTFSHAYDGSVLTTKFINNNRREVNEKAALYVNGSPATLNIDYTLIRK